MATGPDVSTFSVCSCHLRVTRFAPWLRDLPNLALGDRKLGTEDWFFWAFHPAKFTKILGFPFVCCYLLIIFLLPEWKGRHSEEERWKRGNLGPKPDTESSGRMGTNVKDCIYPFLPLTFLSCLPVLFLPSLWPFSLLSWSMHFVCLWAVSTTTFSPEFPIPFTLWLIGPHFPFTSARSDSFLISATPTSSS